MLRKLVGLVSALAAVLIGSAASAQMTKNQVTASNGVVVDRAIDEFAGRAEYSAPALRSTSQQGARVYAIVAKIRRGSALGSVHVQGFVSYTGKWRFFRTAVFKGGDPVNYTRTSGDVGSCRYGCSLTENFRFEITPAEIAKHKSDMGNILVQIRSDSGDTAVIAIPVVYLNAVDEVAK